MKKRILAAFMAAVFTVMQAAGAAPAIQAQAASTVEVGDVNLLEHSDFEDGVELAPHTQGSKVGNWHAYAESGVTEKVKEEAHSGEWAVKMTATGCALEQDEDTLQSGVTYKATVWAKTTNTNARVYFGLKNHGSAEVKVPITSTEYQQYEIPFTYTGSGLPRVYVWIESLSSGAVYVDDFELLADSDLSQVSIENGKITVDYKESYTGTPSEDDFRVVYTNSLTGSEEKELVITDAKVEGTKLELLFDAIEAAPIAQMITADVIYLPKNQTLTVDYTVEANGESIVVADVKSFAAENGTATVVLDKKPTLAPAKEDFTLQKSVNGGAYTNVPATGMSYDAETLTVTLSYGMTNATAEVQEVNVKLTYNGKDYTSQFTVELGSGTIYYVDATEGDDNNNGKSPETAWKTIEKVNTIEFQPGDQILFQCGETWTGSLKPQGSGVEGAPIVIASYGEGAKPVLKPGANWTIPYFKAGANSTVYNATVNNGISFYNQEYWEVRDLELYDPTFNDTTNPSVYRRAVNITAEDCGDLHYFLFDNLTIHGFRGPTDNNGKSSGGIIVTVLSDPYDSSKRVPSAIHDFTVTNCEMYNLGRSGFNFISPWTTRTESEWGTFGYRGYGDWKPNTNIYIANNTIYNIDGDGILIDGCKDVLVEHNVVYRAVMNCWYGVGMFNWNSDNTIFQFNEIYDSCPSDSILGAGDAQGIEIDALNRDTWVQYNYVHDNAGGCIMWCNTNDLRGFRGIYRYNIFQNDMTKHGVIDWRPNHKESMAYNNTFYFGELPEGASARVFMNNGYTNGSADAKFYNNIFYNLDDFDLNTFNELEIDWERNIFYGFDEVPSNDSTIITEDPLFVDPGTGEYGLDSVVGYKLQPGSPAIDAGMNIEDNGGRDYFGTPLVDGMTDIGAAEFFAEGTIGSVVLRYVDTDGNSLRKDRKLYGVVDDAYTITPEAIYGYRFVSMDKYAEGVYTEEEITVTLTYELFTDKEALQAVVDAQKEADKYIPATYNVYKEVLTSAEELLADDKATQKAVDDVLAALVEAEAELVGLDRTELYLAVEYAVGQAGYNALTYNEYQAAVTAGEAVLADTDATAEEVQAAVENIKAKRTALVETTDMVTATANKGYYSGYDYSNWTYISYPFTNMLDGNTATKAWTSGAQTVGDWFLFTFAKPVNLNSFSIQFTSGNDYIYSADVEISADNSNWTKIGTIDNTTTPQYDLTFDAAGASVQYVKITITKTVNNWTQINEVNFDYDVEEVDNSALANAVAEAKDLKAADYTTASWTVFAAALENAEEVLADTGATLGEITAAIDALEACEAALVEDSQALEKEEVCKVFADVEHGAWYEAAVQYVFDEKIIIGDGNMFAPYGETTRAMVAVILYRLAGSPEVTEADYEQYNQFTDLPAEHLWYSDAVAWALKEKVSTGDDYNMLYNPTAPVTRQQLALFLWRYAKYTGEDITVNVPEEELFEGIYVDAWAKDGFVWAVANGIIKGAEATDDAGNVYYDLNPQGGATRAQVAKVLHRYLTGEEM